MLQPAKTKTAEIIDHLNRMKIGDKSNMFYFRRYRNDANALKNARPVEYYEICGAIACLEQNIEDMRSWHQKAITASGNDSNVIVNYGMSLAKLGFYAEAYKMFKKAFGKNPDNSIKLYYIHSCYENGRFFEAYECVRNMSVQEACNVGLLEDEIAQISEAVNILDGKGLTDDDVSRAIACVEGCLQSMSIFGVGRDVSTFTNDEFILYTYFFQFDGVDLLELDYQLEQKLEEAGVSEAVLSVLEFDFAMIDDEKPVQDVVQLSEEKMALVRDLVAHVEL